MKLGKRVAGMLLTLLLVIGVMPVSAFAEAGDFVDIPDQAFRAVLNQALGEGRPEDAAITESDMKNLKSVWINESDDVTNIEGIQYAVNLSTLYVNGDVAGLDKIEKLEQLTSLSILNNDNLTTLSVLGEKPALTGMTLTGCSQLESLEGMPSTLTSLRVGAQSDVTNIRGIEQAAGLKTLELNGSIENINDIGTLEKLTSLSIQNNPEITDLSMLGKKPDLTSLHVDSCSQFTTLDGLTAENCPQLERLDGFRCASLQDISALSGTEFPNLREVDLEGENAITDITPLKGYSLTNLNLEKVDITPENREGYQETIESLTSLETLYMPYCRVTDADTAMFASLQNLKTLVLNMNELTNTDFCLQLPESLTTLGLHGNAIRSMAPLSRLKNLEILGLGDNYVTDFSFVSQLEKLTDGDVRHAEDPFRETFTYGEDEPLEMEDGQLVIENPYIGKDGKPISFAGAEVVSGGGADVTVNYDEETNTIALENVDDSVTIEQVYNLPVAGGEYKAGELRITVYAKEKKSYSVRYDWGTEAPDGQVLPSDTKTYDSLEAAKAAVDTAFTSQTTVKGEKDGKEGVWSFSGWTVTVEGNVVAVQGQWSFTAAEEPTAPTEPTEPTNPTEPTEPTEPTNPTEPTEPTEPTAPTEPEQPTSPSRPETTPAEDKQPETPDAPKTGDTGRPVFWAVLCAAAAGGLGIAFHAKKRQKE